AGTRRGAEFLVSLAVFVSAFALFGLLYEARALGWPIALAAGALSVVLATVPLRRAAADEHRTALYCAVVGLIVGQVAWALTYWTAAAIVGGAFLLLLFYVLVGVSEAVLDRSFGRRVLFEYGLVGACGLVLIVGAGPWHVEPETETLPPREPFDRHGPCRSNVVTAARVWSTTALGTARVARERPRGSARR